MKPIIQLIAFVYRTLELRTKTTKVWLLEELVFNRRTTLNPID